MRKPESKNINGTRISPQLAHTYKLVFRIYNIPTWVWILFIGYRIWMGICSGSGQI
jgi:hypothetical protein